MAKRSRRARRWTAPSPSSKRSSCPSPAAVPHRDPSTDSDRRDRRKSSRWRRQQARGPIATREAYGDALARLGDADSRVVALDADVKNSTFSDKFEAVHPDRFYQCFIAEQGMIGASMGLAARGAIPFPSTFAAFLSRAGDFVRMLAISGLNVKMAGSHAGVSIGEDGPSQMALEDLAMMSTFPNVTVLYPCDAVSTDRLVEACAHHDGPGLHAHRRPKTPVIYDNNERSRSADAKSCVEPTAIVATLIGAGVTVFEALKAHDELKKQGHRRAGHRPVLGAAHRCGHADDGRLAKRGG